MDTILLLMTLLGCIALCLYGMKIMSQGILKFSGAYIRARLRAISSRRLHSFGLGIWVTALMQSSAAMTIMTISLVNAGLLTLGQSIAITMGANVGTTITAWIIALFGYAFPIGYLALPIIVLAFPFQFVSDSRFKPLAEVLLGVSMYILGFASFIHFMPLATALPQTSQVIALVCSWGWIGALVAFLLGICITILFRSSAATIMLTMAAAATGWIDLPIAFSLVIGDNVGTTLSALLASRKANISARRAAYSHVFFNLAGMLWALPIVYPVSRLFSVDQPWQIAMAVALFHTAFNLITAFLLIGFVPQINRLLCRLLPIPEGDEDEFHLHFIEGGLLSTAELSVEEARKEAALFGIRCQKMLQLTTDFIRMSPDSPEFSHTFSRIEKYEKITDRLELEIVRFLNTVDRSSLSAHIASRVRSLFKMVDELESIGDACYSLARIILRKRDHGITFIQMQRNNIERMLEETHLAMDLMVRLLQKTELTPADLNRLYHQEDSINALRTQLRDQNIGSVQAGYYTYQSGVLYMDLVHYCEKIGDYIVNVVEAQAEQADVD